MKLYTIEETNRNIQKTKERIEHVLRFETNEQRKRELENMLIEIQTMEAGMKHRFGDRKGYF